jgi:undecaprenyl-diphosphatase
LIPEDARPGAFRGRLRQRGLTCGRALVLGAIHGPAELLPVSSSAHLSLIPWFAGWPLHEVDPEARKSFEVALHAGTVAALLIGQRQAIADELRRADGRRATAVALATVAPAVVGYTLERQIERRLGRPRTIAAGLVAGSVAMLVADRRPRERGRDDVTPVDGLVLGAAQAVALLRGISRTAATVAAARWRRFTRSEANLLSRTVAVPVIVGATALRGARLQRRKPDRATGRAMTAGAAAAFASALVSQGLISLVDRDGSPLPYAAYRLALATAVVLKLRHE